jgi:VCBS repeat-containing protein
MKYSWILVFLFPLLSQAQDCKLSRETDPFTKETKLSTGFMFFSGASLSIDADSKEVDLLFSLEGANKCFDNNSTAVVFFEGTKVKMNLRNAGTMNCEGLFHFIYKNSVNTTTQLQKLTTQKISQIVFTDANKKEMTVTLTGKDQELLISLGTCLVNEAKTLIR